ncbi:MAG: CHAP domain-containing protein [Bacilli bacterium]|nr:CHAP domain-containing protein [Bacilli bacterium]
MKNKVLFIISLLCLLLISSCANINNNTNNEDINNEIIIDNNIDNDIIIDGVIDEDISDENITNGNIEEDNSNIVPEVDYRGKLVNLAYSQVGIYEGKDAKGNYNNIQKYGAWYGNNGQPWCAMFVSWNWHHAGLSHDLLLKYQGCYTGKEWCEKKGIFKYKKNYTPITGDIVFFLSNGASHTGIVAYCDGTYIYTIEGNRSNKVGIWRIKLNNKTITGYAVPNYPASSTLEDFSWIKEKQQNGKYLWTHVTSGDSTI